MQVYTVRTYRHMQDYTYLLVQTHESLYIPTRTDTCKFMHTYSYRQMQVYTVCTYRHVQDYVPTVRTYRHMQDYTYLLIQQTHASLYVHTRTDTCKFICTYLYRQMQVYTVRTYRHMQASPEMGTNSWKWISKYFFKRLFYQKFFCVV